MKKYPKESFHVHIKLDWIADKLTELENKIEQRQERKETQIDANIQIGDIDQSKSTDETNISSSLDEYRASNDITYKIGDKVEVNHRTYTIKDIIDLKKLFPSMYKDYKESTIGFKTEVGHFNFEGCIKSQNLKLIKKELESILDHPYYIRVGEKGTVTHIENGDKFNYEIIRFNDSFRVKITKLCDILTRKDFNEQYKITNNENN